MRLLLLSAGPRRGPTHQHVALYDGRPTLSATTMYYSPTLYRSMPVKRFLHEHLVSQAVWCSYTTCDVRSPYPEASPARGSEFRAAGGSSAPRPLNQETLRPNHHILPVLVLNDSRYAACFSLLLVTMSSLETQSSWTTPCCRWATRGLVWLL